MPRTLLLGLALFAATLAGCTDPDAGDGTGDDGMMGPGSFHMSMSGMPAGPMAPGQKFNLTVMAQAGMAGMHGTSDHIGAHMWNMSVSDPTGNLAGAMSCAHTGGDLPGEHRAQCTAPMEPGTYYMRAHARVTDGHEHGMHHYWGDETSFTVTSS